MQATDQLAPPETRLAARRRRVRLAAAALSASCALIYFLIGLGVVYTTQTSDERTGLAVFGALAGLAYALGAVLLVSLDRRAAWIFGAAFQVFVIAAYFRVAENRDPPFEVWGILLKVLQVVILGALVYLVLNRDSGVGRPPGGGPTT
jgi:peptidoglycan/LPS O-acetylase OafA/YrhL